MEIKTLIVTVTLVLMTSLHNNKAVSVTDKPPLYLTPLIENHNISKARQLSLIKDDVFPKSFSGLITVDKHHGNHLFFWFFPAESSDPESPLVVWLNGGPGISSMIGLFSENGPVRLNVHENMISSTQWSTKCDTYWSQKFNMLYIDQPVGVGYSYTEDKLHGYRDTQDGIAKDLYEFIKQFYIMFPEYMSRELYIGGQSYAGKYVPAFAYYLHKEILANRSGIPLKGIYLGGPLFDAKTQGMKAAKLYEALGAISKKQADDFQNKFDEFVELGNYTNKNTFEICTMLFPDVEIAGNERNNYLTLEKVKFEEIHEFMNDKKVRDLVHMGNLTYYVIGFKVYTSLSQDIMVSTKSKLAILMDRYKVLIYNGDLDGVISSMMIDAGLMSTDWSLETEYNNSVRIVWGHEHNPKGFYTKIGQLCRVVIRRAGHHAPCDKPGVLLKMMEHFINFGCVQ